MRNTAFAILAGGLGSRMMGLWMPKPLVPFGGGVRLIDFSVQNVRRSGAHRLVVMLKEYRQEIVETLLRSYAPAPEFILDFGPWNDVYQVADLAAVLTRESPFNEVGTADALFTHRRQLDRPGTRDVFILHSDHVYEFDYRAMLEHHRSTNAAATIGYQRIEPHYVSLFGMVVFDARGRLTAFVEKPKTPTHDTVFTAVGVFRTDVLYEVLEALQQRNWAHDISRDVIPTMLDRGDRIVGFPFTQFWTDIGTLERYLTSQMAYVCEGKGPVLDKMVPTLEPCACNYGARSLVAPSATVRGSLQDSILYEQACIMPGASVARSILFPGAVVHGNVRDTVIRAGESVGDREGLATLSQGSADLQHLAPLATTSGRASRSEDD